MTAFALPAQFIMAVCMCDWCQHEDADFFGTRYRPRLQKNAKHSERVDPDNYEPIEQWGEAKLGKLHYFQDGIPRLYCVCGTRVMLIKHTNRSGSAVGDAERMRQMIAAKQVKGDWSLVPICWFCTHKNTT